MAKKSKALLEAEARVAELTALLSDATAPESDEPLRKVHGTKSAGITLGEATAKRQPSKPTHEEFALAHKGGPAKSMCAADECRETTVGKSKYCKPHRSESRARFKAMLKAKAEAKEEQHKRFGELVTYARQQATTAASGPVVAGYVRFAPGNTSFVYWARENLNGVQKSEGGGIVLPLKASDPSIRAFAQAMAKGLSIAEPRVTVLFATG